MRLTDILTPERIRIPLRATTKEGLIEELIGVLAAEGMVDSPEDALQAVLRREATRSTGVGGGLALPHGKSPAAKKLAMAMGTIAGGADFHAADAQPVTLAVLLLGPPEKPAEHIQALARISRLFRHRGLRQRLQACQSPEEAHQIIKEAEDTVIVAHG